MKGGGGGSGVHIACVASVSLGGGWGCRPCFCVFNTQIIGQEWNNGGGEGREKTDYFSDVPFITPVIFPWIN